MLGSRTLVVLTVWPLYLSRPLALAGRAEAGSFSLADGEFIPRAISCPIYDVLITECCSATFLAADVESCCWKVHTNCGKGSSTNLASPTGVHRPYDDESSNSAEPEADSNCNTAAYQPISIITPRTTHLSRMAYTPPPLEKRQATVNATDDSTSVDLLTDILNCGTIGHACNGTCIDPASKATPSCNAGSCQTACVASVAELKSSLSLSQVGGGLIGSLAGILLTNVGIPYLKILRKRYLEHVEFHMPRILQRNRGRGTPIAIWAPLKGHGTTGWG